MQTTLTIRDETTLNREGHIFTLDVLTEQITVRELIWMHLMHMRTVKSPSARSIQTRHVQQNWI